MRVNNKLHISEKNILIIGNRSYKNLGDELILLWTVKLLLEQEKNITIAAYEPEWLEKFLSQFIDTADITFITEIPKGFRSWMRYISEWKLKEWKLRRKIDAVIIGWWEIITEENKNSYRYRLASLLFCLRKPRYLMWGIQLPIKRFNWLLFRFLLKRTKHIFARDHETVHELKTYGFNNVEFFMDTAYFAYPRASFNHLSVSTVDRSEKYIIVNINKNGEQFFEEILQDVKEYIEQWYEVYFVPVSIGTNKEYSDIFYYHKLKTSLKLEAEHVTLLEWKSEFEYFVKMLAGASIVISTRLHLFLIASFIGVPTKVYPYQRKILKMQNTIKDLSIKT